MTDPRWCDAGAEVPSQLGFLFHQVHLIAVIRNGQGGGHTCDASPHHQSGLMDRGPWVWARDLLP